MKSTIKHILTLASLFLVTGSTLAQQSQTGLIDQITGDSLTAAKFNQVNSAVNDNATDAEARFVFLESQNIGTYIVIDELSDLPAPVADVITLTTNNLTYVFEPNLDIGVNRIVVTGEKNCLFGVNAFVSGITSTNTGALITCNESIKIENMILIGSGTHGYTGTDLSAETLLVNRSSFIGFDIGIYLEDYQNALIGTCSFINCGDGIKFAGDITNGVVELCSFTGNTGICIDLNGCTSKAWSMLNNVATLEATSTFLNVSVDSGNILAGGAGTISSNKTDNTLNGTVTSGYSPYDARWTVIGNSDIAPSDVIAPGGWANYRDSVVGNIGVSTTPVKLTINGLDAATDEESLPVAMIAEGQTLWDTSTNEIVAATLRDSYSLRVQLTLDNESGNPLQLGLTLDIGGAASPTIIVATAIQSIRGGAQTYQFNFPYFTKETFMLNNGQLFLTTDTGTVDVVDRSIFIERISSGVR